MTENKEDHCIVRFRDLRNARKQQKKTTKNREMFANSNIKMRNSYQCSINNYIMH